MNGENIKEKIKDMIVERLFLDAAPEDIGDEDPLAEKYEIDSVRLFEMVIGIEELFGVIIDEAEFDIGLFKNVNSIAEYVRSKKDIA